MISSSIIYGFGSIVNNTLAIEKGLFPSKIVKILEQIDIGKDNNIKWKEIVELKSYFVSELIKNGYIINIPIIGTKA